MSVVDLSRVEPLLDDCAPPGWVLRRLVATARGDVALELDGPARFALRFGGHGARVRTPVGPVAVELESAAASGAAHAALSRVSSWALPLAALFPHLIADDPDRLSRVLASQPPWARALAAVEPAPELFLDPRGVAAWLAPNLAIGSTLAEHVLRSIEVVPTRGPRICLLRFEHAPSGRAVRILLGPRDALPGAFASASELALRFDDEITTPSAVLGSWLIALAALRGSKLRVPLRAHEVRALSVPATTSAAPATVHLQLNVECHQACVFCPIRATTPARDDGDAELDELVLQLRSAREGAATHVQLNGFDPLSFSRILELVEVVRDLGFQRLTAMGPQRRFADRAFRDAFLARAPRDTRIVVPLYGVTALVHEAVTGRPGSHAEVLAAIEALLEVSERVHLALSNVVTSHNVHELAALAAFARARRLPLWSQPVYPLARAPDGAFRGAAVRESEVVAAFLAHLSEVPIDAREQAIAWLDAAARHPCVRFAAGLTHEGPAWPLAAPDVADATVPCEHVDRCSLADRCPREHYRAYVALFGTDEFVPVEPRA